jgi:hypothetical protein
MFSTTIINVKATNVTVNSATFVVSYSILYGYKQVLPAPAHRDALFQPSPGTVTVPRWELEISLSRNRNVRPAGLDGYSLRLAAGRAGRGAWKLRLQYRGMRENQVFDRVISYLAIASPRSQTRDLGHPMLVHVQAVRDLVALLIWPLSCNSRSR